MTRGGLTKFWKGATLQRSTLTIVNRTVERNFNPHLTTQKKLKMEISGRCAKAPNGYERKG